MGLFGEESLESTFASLWGGLEGSLPPGACSRRGGRCSPFRSCQTRISIYGGVAL